jgi:ABC-type phosphate transport system auxiliary subunit
MSRQVLLMLIGIVVIIIIAALAFTQFRPAGALDFQATRESSETSCADLYEVGSEAYKLCLDG